MELDTVVCADALEFLRGLPDGCADAVITDPPFNLGFNYGPYSTDKRPLAEYGAWLWEIIEEAERCLTPGSPVFVWQAMPHCREWAGWFPREWRIFAATKNWARRIGPAAMHYSWDPVIVWWTEGEPFRLGPSVDQFNRDWFMADLWRIVVAGGIQREHPTPKPLDLLRFIIGTYVRPGGTVIDPFLGSGTTALAAKATGRHFLGCEINPEYVALAQDRLRGVRSRAGGQTQIDLEAD